MDVVRDPAVGAGAPAASGGTQTPPYRKPPPQPAAAATSAQLGATASRRATEPPPPRASISQFTNDVREAFSARFHLFELEAKRAAWSAAYMLAFAVGAALLGVTAWLILIGALIYGAVAAGVPWVLAAVVAIALHAVGAFLLVRAIHAKVEYLTFAATRRTLAKQDSAQAPDGSRL